MPETTPLIKAALNLRGGAGFDVYAIINYQLLNFSKRPSLSQNVIPLQYQITLNIGTFEEMKKKTDNSTQAQMVMYSKLFKINFTKMDPYEFKTFTDILQRYSDLCKPVKGNGRGRKEK